VKHREGADKVLLSYSDHQLQLKKYKKEQQKELKKMSNYKDDQGNLSQQVHRKHSLYE